MFGHSGLCAAIWLFAANDVVLEWPDEYFLLAASLLLTLGVVRRFERR